MIGAAPPEGGANDPDCIGTCLIWQADINVASEVPTSPIITGAAAVTRAADAYSLAVTALPWYANCATANSSYVFVNPKEYLTGVGGIPFGENHFSVYYGTWRFSSVNRIAVRTSQLRDVKTGAGVVTNRDYKMATGIDSTPVQSTALDGVLELPDDATVSAPGSGVHTSLLFGQGNGGEAETFHGHIKEVMFLPRKMTNTGLQQVTS